MTMQWLKDIAYRIKDNRAQSESTYLLSYSFWSLLRQVSPDEFIEAYIATSS